MRAAGFAFAVPMPFDIFDLFSQVGVALTPRPFTPTQQVQSATVKQFLKAFHRQDWAAVLKLCTEEVVYFPIHGSEITAERALHGKDALRAYCEGITHTYPQTDHAHLRVHARPHGLVARYTGLWRAPTPAGSTPRAWHTSGSVAN